MSSYQLYHPQQHGAKPRPLAPRRCDQRSGAQSAHHHFRPIRRPTSALLLDAYVQAFRNVFRFGLGLTLLAFVVTLLFTKEFSLDRKDDEKRKQEGKTVVSAEEGEETCEEGCECAAE